MIRYVPDHWTRMNRRPCLPPRVPASPFWSRVPWILLGMALGIYGCWFLEIFRLH